MLDLKRINSIQDKIRELESEIKTLPLEKEDTHNLLRSVNSLRAKMSNILFA